MHDKVRTAAVWHAFCSRFLRMDTSQRDAPLGADVPRGAGLPKVGDIVTSPYGRGVVASVRWGNCGVLREDDDAPARARAAAQAEHGTESSPSASSASSSSSSGGKSPAAGAAPEVMAVVRLVGYGQSFVALSAAKLRVVEAPELVRVRAGITGGTGSGFGSMAAGGGVATGSATQPAQIGRAHV